MLCKKCEPEQKTASKSVGAEQRESLACVEKKKSGKNPRKIRSKTILID